MYIEFLQDKPDTEKPYLIHKRDWNFPKDKQDPHYVQPSMQAIIKKSLLNTECSKLEISDKSLLEKVVLVPKNYADEMIKWLMNVNAIENGLSTLSFEKDSKTQTEYAVIHDVVKPYLLTELGVPEIKYRSEAIIDGKVKPEIKKQALEETFAAMGLVR